MSYGSDINDFELYVSELMLKFRIQLHSNYILHTWNMIHLLDSLWIVYIFVTMSKVNLSPLFMPYFSLLLKFFHAQWIECKKKITFIYILQRKPFEMRRYLFLFLVCNYSAIIIFFFCYVSQNSFICSGTATLLRKIAIVIRWWYTYIFAMVWNFNSWKCVLVGLNCSSYCIHVCWVISFIMLHLFFKHKILDSMIL